MKRLVNFILFVVYPVLYAGFVCYACLFKNVAPLEVFSPDRVHINSVNLVPFHTIGEYLVSNNIFIAMSNILGNIILFIPLGIYLKLLGRRNFWMNLLIIVLGALLIESLQYLFLLGAVDVDDVILNTVGGVLGMSICNGFYAVFRKEHTVRLALVVSSLIIILLPIIAVKMSGMNLKLI